MGRALGRGAAAGVIGALATMVLSALLPLLWGWQPYLVATGSMTPLIRPGDVVVAAPYDGHRLATGAVVVVAPPRGTHGMIPLTHRVVGRTPDGRYLTKGDANPTEDHREVSPVEIRAQVRFLVPFVGLPRLALTRPATAGFAAWAAVLLVLAALVLLPPQVRQARRARHGRRAPAYRRAAVALVAAVAVVAAVALLQHTAQATFAARTTPATSGFTTKSQFYAQAVIASAPTSYWRLDEASGNPRDTVGTANLTYGGSVTRGVAGALHGDRDTAAHFTASSYAVAPAGVLSFAGTFSIAAWVRTTITQTAGARILIKYDGTWVNYLMAYDLGTGTNMRFAVDTTGTPSRYTAQVPLAADGGWHFLVGMYTGSSVQLYVDGALGQSMPAAGTIKTVATPASLSDSSNALRGDLDEVAMWPRLLTTTEISQLYSLGTT